MVYGGVCVGMGGGKVCVGGVCRCVCLCVCGCLGVCACGVCVCVGVWAGGTEYRLFLYLFILFLSVLPSSLLLSFPPSLSTSLSFPPSLYLSLFPSLSLPLSWLRAVICFIDPLSETLMMSPPSINLFLLITSFLWTWHSFPVTTLPVWMICLFPVWLGTRINPSIHCSIIHQAVMTWKSSYGPSLSVPLHHLPLLSFPEILFFYFSTFLNKKDALNLYFL